MILHPVWLTATGLRRMSPVVLSQQSRPQPQPVSVSSRVQSLDISYLVSGSVYWESRSVLSSPDRVTKALPVRMSRPGYKTKSDTMLLRRLINNLKERGSEVAGELERKAHNFLTDVQMKRKPVEVCLLNNISTKYNAFKYTSYELENLLCTTTNSRTKSCCLYEAV